MLFPIIFFSFFLPVTPVCFWDSCIIELFLSGWNQRLKGKREVLVEIAAGTITIIEADLKNILKFGINQRSVVNKINNIRMPKLQINAN